MLTERNRRITMWVGWSIGICAIIGLVLAAIGISLDDWGSLMLVVVAFSLGAIVEKLTRKDQQ